MSSWIQMTKKKPARKKGKKYNKSSKFIEKPNSSSPKTLIPTIENKKMKKKKRKTLKIFKLINILLLLRRSYSLIKIICKSLISKKIVCI